MARAATAMLGREGSAGRHTRITGGVALGAGVFLLCLIGILSRPHFDLATFWPANAFMLGMLVRFPRIAGPVAWASCGVGFFMADAITGADIVKNAVLNGGNLVAIAVGYAMLAPLSTEDRMLRRPASILYFLRGIIAASLAAGFTGTVADPLLFGGKWQDGFIFWSATELVNYAAFLPMFLTLPPIAAFSPASTFAHLRKLDIWKAMPLLALALSAGAGVLIGGPGAVAFPVPALLWCALTYSLFTTSCLAFAFGAWTLLAIRTDILFVGTDIDSRAMLISMRMGVSLIALAPLVISSVMLARNELMKQLQYLADRDAMTGLHNRRAFLEVGSAVLSASIDSDKPVAVMMLDIDHFKSINDRFGHDAGDRVLSAFAEILVANLRPEDKVGRIGGEEFGIVLPDCTVDDAGGVAARINEALRIAEIALDNGRSVRVTVSIGIHLAHRERRLDRLLNHADDALYRAKTLGRDRFELSPVQR